MLAIPGLVFIDFDPGKLRMKSWIQFGVAVAIVNII
jgi:hypothetical protein